VRGGYARAGKSAEALALAKENLVAARKSFPVGSPQLADELARNGSPLLDLKAWDDAEPLLRECAEIRRIKALDDWRTFNAESMWGAALLGQKKYAEAEPLLVHGYEGMNQRQGKIPSPHKVRLTEALERLVRLYEAWEKPDQAAKWRKEWEAAGKAAKP
jgi:hypothetical protein